MSLQGFKIKIYKIIFSPQEIEKRRLSNKKFDKVFRKYEEELVISKKTEEERKKREENKIKYHNVARDVRNFLIKIMREKFEDEVIFYHLLDKDGNKYPTTIQRYIPDVIKVSETKKISFHYSDVVSEIASNFSPVPESYVTLDGFLRWDMLENAYERSISNLGKKGKIIAQVARDMKFLTRIFNLPGVTFSEFILSGLACRFPEFLPHNFTSLDKLGAKDLEKEIGEIRALYSNLSNTIANYLKNVDFESYKNLIEEKTREKRKIIIAEIKNKYFYPEEKEREKIERLKILKGEETEIINKIYDKLILHHPLTAVRILGEVYGRKEEEGKGMSRHDLIMLRLI
jgi:hypothetical protein